MQGLKAFQADEGMLPDIVSFATNYWDIAALCVLLLLSGHCEVLV